MIRLNEILVTVKMLFVFFSLLTSNFNSALGLIKEKIADQFVSLVILPILLFLILILRRKIFWLGKKCSWNALMIILLLLLFLFAPLLAPYDDNLQFNLPQAKRLTPFSTQHLIEKVNSGYGNNKLNTFHEYEGLLFRETVSSDYYLDDKMIENEIPGENKSAQITFVLGTDEYGRDVLSRIIYATRYSLMISFFAIVISGVLGIVLGFLSGYYGGYTDVILNRIVEMFLAIPFIFLVILSVAFLGDSLATVIIILGLAGWMSLFKVVRSEVLKLKTRDHIVTAKMIGMSLSNLLTKEYLPLLLPSIIVNIIFQFAYILVAESSLSFLGITGNYSHPSLGGMIQQGFSSLSNAWWIALFPTIVITWIFLVVHNAVRKTNSTETNIFR